MVLPRIQRCCWCLSLKAGALLMTILSLLMCLAGIGLGSWLLPRHREWRNEDNLVLLCGVMFATLSAVSHIAALLGMQTKRPNWLQLSLMTNCVFAVCLLLVGGVSLLFSAALRPRLEGPGLALALFALMAGAVYSLYNLTVISNLYTKMKASYGSALPV